MPLPLESGELEDLRVSYEPYRSPDLYAPLWRKLTAKPRASFRMDPIAWGVSLGRNTEENVDADDFEAEDDLTCQAAELAKAGDREGARELLMEALCIDLRCIDAHAHLGSLEFDRRPERAIVHYEIGMRIGELSLPPLFDGALLWGPTTARSFAACTATVCASGGSAGSRPPQEDDENEPWAAPPSRRHNAPAIGGDLPRTVELVLGNQIYVAKDGLPPGLLNLRIPAMADSGSGDGGHRRSVATQAG